MRRVMKKTGCKNQTMGGDAGMYGTKTPNWHDHKMPFMPQSGTSGVPPRSGRMPASLAVRRLFVSVFALVLAASAHAQPLADTLARTALVPPRATLQRALIVPGWGQLTNRQPAKAAVVWGALTGTGGTAAFVHTRYREAGRAYLYKACTDDPTTCKVPAATTDYASDYERRYDGLSAATVRQSRDRLRRNRDLLLLGIGLVYAVQAADAYVSAHLRGFDDDERLSLAWSPDGPRLALRVPLP